MKNAGLLFFSFFLLLISSHINGQVNELEKYGINTKAPQIFAKDVKGNVIRLKVILNENKKVLLCFFRPIWCPICNQRTHQLIKRYEELKEKGIEVVAIYPTKEETLAQYVNDANIPFHVIADPDELLYKSYAVERNMDKVMAAMKRDDIKVAYKEGKELYNGKKYARKNGNYDPIVNADFVIGAKRMLEVAYYGKFAGDHYSLDEMLKLIED
jgi:peroxiredoxin Q/BCP